MKKLLYALLILSSLTTALADMTQYAKTSWAVVNKDMNDNNTDENMMDDDDMDTSSTSKK